MYNFLSQVQISPDGKKVAYVATTPDLAKNGYNANLYRIDAESGENACLTNSGRVKGFCWQGAETLLYTVPVEADDAFPDGQTVLYRQNAGSAAEEVCRGEGSLSLEGVLTDGSIVFSRVDNLTTEAALEGLAGHERLAARLAEKERNEVCTVFDEYPFWFNGKGVINKTRKTLYLWDGKELKRITPPRFRVMDYGSLYDNDPCFMEKSQPGWYTTKGEEFFCQNDPEKAKELLAQSSFDTSKPLRILTATGGGAEAMLEVLRQEAAKIGVTLEITATDRTTMTSMRNDETLYDAYFTTFSSVAVPSLRNFLSADYAGWSDDEHLQELMLQMTTAATKEAAFATWEEIQYYCYSDYCPILMMGHFHQAAACTNRLTGYNVFLTTNFWNAKLAK